MARCVGYKKNIQPFNQSTTNWSYSLPCSLPSPLPFHYDPTSTSQRCPSQSTQSRFASPTSISPIPGILTIFPGPSFSTQTRKSHISHWSHSWTLSYWLLCSRTSTKSPQTGQKRFEKFTGTLSQHSSISSFLLVRRASQDASTLCAPQFLFQLGWAAALPYPSV